MADQSTAVLDDPQVEAAPRSRRRLLVLAAIVVVAALAGLYVTGMLPGVSASADEAEPAEPVEGAIVEVGELTTGVGGQASAYVRIGFAVVLAEGFAEADVAERFPLLKDAVLTEVSRATPDALRTPEGMQQLRRSLTDRAGTIYPDGEVLRVVLTQLLVQ